ncbi:uncharacterized protein TNCV_1310431 [Trichonephila clavipes]|nr:uncharacterized protein TNCV_1310431 [Trichonephila clavipes]
MNFNGFGATEMFSINVHIYTSRCSVCYKQSADNARSIAFSQLASSTYLIKDETVNDRDIINNLIDYEDGPEEPDSLRADKIYAGIQLSNKLENNILKIDTNSERSEISKRSSIMHIWLL